MSGRDVITWLVGLMVAGVLVWAVTAWVYTSATTRVSGTLLGLMMGGLLLWGLAWRLEPRGTPPPTTREPRRRFSPTDRADSG
jgi:hypothetical protein